MRAAYLLSAIVLFLTLPLGAQQTGLTVRTPEGEAARRHLEGRLTLDLQVTNAKGQAVHGLTLSDLRLSDNGAPRDLTSLHEIAGRTSQPPVEAILILDAMNASFESVGILRQGVDRFLKQDGGHLPIPISLVFLTDTGTRISKPSVNGLELAEDLGKLRTPLRVLDSAQGVSGAMDRLQRSLKALEMVATYEASMPGRKLVLWMGPGWPLLSARTSAPSAKDARRYYSSIVEFTTSIRRAHMTLYSLIPLNLSHGNLTSTFVYEDYLKGVSDASQADSPYLAVQVLSVHSGGLVLNGTGDLGSEIVRCIADADSYYEVTFDAASGDAAGSYHAITVTANRPGTHIRTSAAYYAGLTQTTNEHQP